jgi:hypothetical protein
VLFESAGFSPQTAVSIQKIDKISIFFIAGTLSAAGGSGLADLVQRIGGSVSTLTVVDLLPENFKINNKTATAGREKWCFLFSQKKFHDIEMK